MQAITTKYFGPGPVKGSRVKATAQAGSITLDWDDALNYDRNHAAAAKALATKLGWTGPWVGGGLPGGAAGMAWVFAADNKDTFAVTPKEK